MAPQRPEDGFVRMPEHEFEAIPARAAEEGAKRALVDVGLEGNEAALDTRDLRSLADCLALVLVTPAVAQREITIGSQDNEASNLYAGLQAMGETLEEVSGGEMTLTIIP